MNEAQWHLVLNHLPVTGTLFSLLLLSWALIRRNPELLKTALVAVLLVGLTSIPAYLTGEPAEHVIEHLPGVDKAFIEEHETMGKFALACGVALSVFAAAALGVGLRSAKGLWTGALVVWLANALVFGVMGYTAHLGGMIRHPEIRGSATTPANAAPNAEHEAEQD
ncbi:MAG: hypothetical protein CFK49_07905 [Armatimonadetes bacterium JP3_11]|nr:MAG: hypothetical protein CFK48_02445 [Armatimonadetes bacterium CP1_7O]OYT74531.1 MAG: hypothetical protein CFK49_07905 [Armatimonadetes bacterium JP3_11]RMH06449.1 MAG: hypothetical protein D6697_10520 [Armatimonadota bacterium]